MFAIFKQTYKKLLFTVSTIFFMFIVWLIFFLTFKLEITSQIIWKSEVVTNTFHYIIQQYNGLFIWFILPPFVGAKAAGFIVDELEDGTFLTVLSKPVSRSRIMIEKFAALLLVNTTFIVASLGLAWWFALKSMPFYSTASIFFDIVPTMFIIPFVFSTIISVILTILSLKIRAALIIGLGTGLGIVSLMAAKLLTPTVIGNTAYQGSLGKVIEVKDADPVIKKQNRYSKFKYLNYSQHADQVYFEQASVALKKYNLDKASIAQINKEVIFEDFDVVKKNKIGEKEIIVKKIVKATRFWIPTKTLKILYTFLTLITLMFGFLYFKRKDII